MLSPDIKRAALMTASGALFAWMGAASTPVERSHVREKSPSRSAPLTEAAAVTGPPAVTIERLHDWRHLAEPPSRARNLFAFGAPAPRAFVRETGVAEKAAAIVEPAAPPAPVMKFEGIAEDVTETGTIRTAIIAVDGQLFLVTDGDALTARYRVTGVSSSAVDLADLVTGAPVQLFLK